ncbi:hypothetical protein [Vibrio ziniensis]|uniref:Uncharacterized protein n=1 Tax=Vibrio ziniensis TaxID=2711221 RepID=A0A6G7CN01_9VIBR|nr:hypothetical protein [Vibrio ziniensis]QIH43475.1 hypothetical protein G5S32_15875 [Vibrio ziniensis]
MKTLTQESFEQLRKHLESLPKERITDYCREHGFHNVSPALLTEFEISSSIKAQGSLAV